MTAPPDGRPTRIGTPTSRVDGWMRVTGAARYGSDYAVPHQAYAYLRTSAIARGRITGIDETGARSLPGVLDILTYRNVGDAIKPGRDFARQGVMDSTVAPLASDRVWYAGQIVAMVIAESFEQARDAAGRLRIDYAAEPAKSTFADDDFVAAERSGAAGQSDARSGTADPAETEGVGDPDGAQADSPVTVDAWYATPTQHHNPIELFTTTCAWTGSRLTVWESSRNVTGFRNGLAEQLGIDADDVRVVSPYIGGAFGSRGFLNQRTAIVALAARRLKRPVRLAVTRAQMFTIATYRAETRQHVRLGATPDGRLRALTHRGWEISSRADTFKVAGTESSTRLYDCPNVGSAVTVVHADRNTPGFMRCPPEVVYLFAIESAMDELSYALGMDPVELRRINDTMVEPVNGRRYTSRNLVACLDAAADAFGWADRDPRPGSMVDGDWQIGYGCAAMSHTAFAAPASARITVSPQGWVRVQTGGHDVGGGLGTAIAMTVSDLLEVPLGRISVDLGDSDLPPGPIAGGSMSTASVCSAVAKACEQIRVRRAATTPGDGGGAIEAYAEFLPRGVPDSGRRMLYAGSPMPSGGYRLPDRAECSFGAVFVEVRVHRQTREVRLPRIVGAYAAGRVINPKTAESQLMGAQIFGTSMALYEGTDLDERYARYTNTNLADYHIPVNADITDHQIIIIPEIDNSLNELGIKGVGELATSGVNAAIANAVHHATGVRIRELPIRLEKLLSVRA
ncbi:xanthine dehydrogenase family protein molybdopterin-binding subunit [Micromonospora sp. NBC_01699]|uniref:xanthine dehydrogenase family protein molybdopterin-binding subunit n=1 Tax=Micromonospora sp. NBC_01699 TaxID=2975984 RepID=UPI002E2DD045|nr:xanthine dehydrogenase family protein molybdopterin-binding subunit [Micromonospora sp. NBC_01699]